MTSPHSCRSVCAAPSFSQQGYRRAGKVWGKVLLVLVIIIAGLGYVVMQRKAERDRQAAAATRAQEIEPIISKAQKTALSNEAVAAAVGDKPAAKNAVSLDPISSELNANGTTVNIDLVGSKGTVKLVANAKQVDTNWQLTKLEATLPDNKKLDIELPSEDAPPEFNFDTGN